MKFAIFGNGQPRRRTLGEAIRILEDGLSDKALVGDDRKQVLDELERLSRIADGRKTALSNVTKAVGTVAILAFAAWAGFQVDRSDDAITNKTSFSLFGKLARL